MKDERIWNLIGKKLAGEASQAELLAIEEWLQLHPHHPLLYKSILSYWQATKVHKEQDALHAWQKLSDSLEQFQLPAASVRKNTHNIRWQLGVAASFILLLSAWWLFPHLQQGWWQLSAIEQENSRGARSTILLPDGSKVWLNADSKLTYPRNYGAANRTVYLKGEAFFDVKKNAQLPFLIHLEAHLIKVLGTSFNVESYEEDAQIETSVLTGEVLFVNIKDMHAKNDSILIRSNQKVSVDKATGSFLKVAGDSREDMAWTEGKLVFKNETLEQIAKKLERSYGISFRFADPSLRLCRLTATFHNKSLKQILELIALTEDFSYELGEVVILKGKGCRQTGN